MARDLRAEADPRPRGEVHEAAWRDHAVEILLQVAESMTAADGVQGALARLARLALRATGADRCAILVPEAPGASRLFPAAAASRVGDEKEQWKRFRSMRPIDLDSAPRLRTLWGRTSAMTLDDAPASRLIPPDWMEAWGSKSLALAALRAGGETYGVLIVDYAVRPHSFSPAEARLLDAIASAAGVALHGARLVEQLQRSIDVERRLAECTAAVRSGKSLDEVLSLVTDRYTSLLRGTSCAIFLLSADQTSFRPLAHRGIQPPASEIHLGQLPPGHVAYVRALWERAPQSPVVLEDVGALEGWQGVIPDGIGPGMLIPLWDGRDVLGFVAVGRREGRFGEDEVRVAAAFADQTALAVTQARLHDTLQMRLRVIEALHRLSDLVVRGSNLRALLRSLNRGIGADIGVRCVRVTFSDPALVELLRVNPPLDGEATRLRRWRALGTTEPEIEPPRIFAPIAIGGRVAGILRLREIRPVDASGMELVKAIAGGLGEVAYKAKLRRTAEVRAQELAVAAERERIARDLHDTVGQAFYGIGLKLQDLIADLQDEALATRAGHLRSLAAQGVADVRSAVYALSFLHVRARGFLPSLRVLARQFSGATGVEAEVRTEGPVARLPQEVQSALYRVAHEALVNVDRHARATGVVVALARGDDAIHMSIRDDGVGLDQRQARDWRSAAHFGMRTMAKAIAEVGGAFRVEAAQPRGLLIRARVPLERSTSGATA